MFDISWTEFLLIGIVALVFIGPKELPGVMRTLGQYTRKIRGMAADFQGQFQEAMREAEMADLKKSVDDLAHDIKSYDPLKSAREDVEAIGKDLNKDFEKKPLDLLMPQEPSAGEPTSTEAGATEPNITEPSTIEPGTAGGEPELQAVAPESAVTESAVTEPAPTAAPESTERTG
jgi:sec-independent protein translocase protein TatB